MNVTIFGTGYVGLVTAACLAEVGNRVLGVDIDQAKIDALRGGAVPFFEPDLAELVAANVASGRLEFATDAGRGVAHGDIVFIAVGTPPDDDGAADLQQVLGVARTIAAHLDAPKIVVAKSTVPVGTCDRMRGVIAGVLAERGVDAPFAVVSNPEFLKEGAAVADFQRPDRIVIGCDAEASAFDAEAGRRMADLYTPFNRSHDRLLAMDVRSAEFTKYAANVMLAARISLMNEFANLSERLGADIAAVREGIGADPRIGYRFIYPGCGYGGSCFPKDVRALSRMAAEAGVPADIAGAVERVNDRQKLRLFDGLRDYFGGDLAGRCIALWGLAFKPNTDDMREAPSRTLMESLWDAGATVRAFDPMARDEARRIYGERPDLTLCAQRDDVLAGADALAVATDWNAFKSPDFDAIKAQLSHPAIFDGRNLYDPAHLAELGFDHFPIGRRARR